MKAMILAAGRGERMQPISDTTPKPLLKVDHRCLIDFHLEAFANAGIRDVVINVSWLADQITEYVGDGSRYQLRVEYSLEPEGALETGGGILKALPLLGDEPFLVVNADIWSNMDFGGLAVAKNDLAHLVLVDNPPHHSEGDFALSEGRVRDISGRRLTFSGVGVYRPELFAGVETARFPLVPVLRSAMRADRVSGEHFEGGWMDIGTPDRLQALRFLLGGADDGR